MPVQGGSARPAGQHERAPGRRLLARGRGRAHRRRGGGVLIALLASCSLGPSPGECTDDQQCRSAFGFGFGCGGDGYCVETPIDPRCGTSYPPDLLVRPEEFGDAFVLASLFQPVFDGPMIRSAELAVREADEGGGIDGRQVAILHCDNDDSAVDGLDYLEVTPLLAKRLVDDLGVQAIIGPSSSDATLAAYTAIEPLGAVLVSPSASSPLLTTADGTDHTDDEPGTLWRTVPPDDLQAIAMVDDFTDRGVSSIAIVNQVGTYGTALADAVANLFQDEGGEVFRSSFENDSERALAISQVPSDTTIEVVFISSAVGDIVEFVDAAALSSLYEGRAIFLSDAGSDPYLLDTAGDPAVADIFPNIRGTRPQIPQGAVFDLFQIAYGGAFDGEDPAISVYAAYTYDAAWLALYGAAWDSFQEPPIDGLGIARGMRRTVDPAATFPTPIQASSWPTVLDTFRADGRIDAQGASGPLDFDPSTGEVSNPIEVWVIVGGQFVALRLCEPGAGCEDITGP